MRVVLAQQQKSSRKFLIPLLVIGLPLVILAIIAGTAFVLNSRAEAAAPQRILVGNYSATGATIAWTTPDIKTIPTLEWGETEDLGKTETDLRDKNATATPRNTHIVELSSLESDKEYFYRIKQGNNLFPAADQKPYAFRTSPLKTQTTGQAVSVYGAIEKVDTDDVLITSTIQTSSSESQPLITFPKSDGSWYLNIALATPQSGNKPLIITEKNIVLLTFDNGMQGTSIKSKAEESPLLVKLQDNLFSQTQSEVSGISDTQPGTANTAVINPTTTTKITVTPSVATQFASGQIDFVELKQDIFLNQHSAPTPSVTNAPGGFNTNSASIQFSIYSSPTITNVTDSSFSVFWLTPKKETSALSYSTTNATVLEKVFDDRDFSSPRDFFVHYVTLKKLSNQTSYSFAPASTNIAKSFTVPAPISAPAPFQAIFGTVENVSGECVMKTSAQSTTQKSGIISTLLTGDGNWSINIGPLRTDNYQNYFNAAAKDTIKFDVVCVDTESAIKIGSKSMSVSEAQDKPVTITLTEVK